MSPDRKDGNFAIMTERSEHLSDYVRVLYTYIHLNTLGYDEFVDNFIICQT